MNANNSPYTATLSESTLGRESSLTLGTDIAFIIPFKNGSSETIQITSDYSHAETLEQMNLDHSDEDGSGREHLKPVALFVVMLSLVLSCFLIAIDTSIVSTAIPVITNEFNTIKDVSWYGSAYLLANSIVIPLTGPCYKYFPMKVWSPRKYAVEICPLTLCRVLS